MKRKHALRKAKDMARNINNSTYLWRSFDTEQQKVTWVATTYLPPKGWAKKWAAIAPTGDVDIIKV